MAKLTEYVNVKKQQVKPYVFLLKNVTVKTADILLLNLKMNQQQLLVVLTVNNPIPVVILHLVLKKNALNIVMLSLFLRENYVYTTL